MATVINGTTGVNKVQAGVIVEEDLNPTFYEEGTWLPTIEGSTTAGVGTYTLQRGWYYRVGRLVTIGGTVTLTGHTGTGNIRIVNLPKPITAEVKDFTGSVALNNVAFTSPTISLYGLGGSQYIAPYQTASNAAITGIPIDTACGMYFEISYLTDLGA